MPSGVAFFGYGELGVVGLDTLISAGAPVAAVVVPGNRAGDHVNLVRDAATHRHIPVLVQPSRRDVASFVEALRAIGPDVIIAWSYSMILPASVLAIPAHGAVNVHGGPLPEYRGGHVAQWAIINGEREFGVTLHYMDEGIDTGPIIDARRFPLDDIDDARSLRHRTQEAGSDLLRRWWPRIADGTAPRSPQDSSRATYWPIRTAEDGRIMWTMTAQSICRLVRALGCNTPGAYVEAAGGRVSIRQAESHLSRVANAPPGQILAADRSSVRVATMDGDLVISLAEIDGQPIETVALADLLATTNA